MKHIKNFYHKLLVTQGNPSWNEQSYIDSLKVRLRIKERQYAGAANYAEQALNGYGNESSGKAFGGAQANAQKYLKKYYKDLFEKVDFERDELKKLNSTEKWEKLK